MRIQSPYRPSITAIIAIVMLLATARPALAEKLMREAIRLDPRYAHPDRLVEALTCDLQTAERFKAITHRLRRR